MRPLLTILILMLASSFPVVAATYTVVNTNNSGAGSFRQAILDANSNSGHDTIEFNIPGSGPHTISPISGLHKIEDSLTIDGYSQTGAARATDSTSAVIMIELDGSNAGSSTNAIHFSTGSDSSRVSGLCMNSFMFGVYLEDTKGVQVDGNYIGTDVTGTSARPNHASGIEIFQNYTQSNLIGGSTAGERNIISGNTADGVFLINTYDNIIMGNYIGTDVTGTSALPNGENGIESNSGGGYNTFGGGNTGEGNVISGNGINGIYLNETDSHYVKGNFIGTNAEGTAAIPNAAHGIHCVGTPGTDNTIGGSSPGERNVISGNSNQGIQLEHSSGNTIIGNYIGIDANGVHGVTNGYVGISLKDSSNDNKIGGSSPGEGNVLSGNWLFGLEINGSSGTIVEGNYIGTNAAGTAAVCNNYDGISISSNADNNSIGGPTAEQRNIISGNVLSGIDISDSKNNSLEGNYIGTDLSGFNAVPNHWGGICISEGADDNTIGGSGAGQGNLISCNSHYGIQIHDATGNAIEGNYIGTDAGGTNSLGNNGQGIDIVLNCSGSTIGGSDPGAGNIIAFNTDVGVSVDSCTGVAIQRNSIFSNTTLGIDLGHDGATPNDPDDPDEGANRLQNFPVIENVIVLGTDLQITYSVPSLPSNCTYPLDIEFYIADGDQGKDFIGSDTYASTGTTMITFTPEVPVDPGDSLLAAATDDLGNSSEFGAVFLAVFIHEDESGGLNPVEFDLFSAGPNPGHGCAVMGVAVPETAVLEINLFDISGRIVERIVDGSLSPGFYEIQVVNLVPGIYFCRMRSGDFWDVERVVIIE